MGEKIILNKPVNLNLEEIIVNRYPKLKKISKKDGGGYTVTMTRGMSNLIPSMYYIIHVLLDKQSLRIDSMTMEGGYTRLYSRDIEPFRSRDTFARVWYILKYTGILDVRCSPKPNRYRKSAANYYFKLSSLYEKEQLTEHEVEVNEKIYKKLYEKDSIWFETRKQFKNDRVLLHQYDMLDNMIYNTNAALLFSKELLDSGQIDITKYNIFIINIKNLQKRRLRMTHSKACGRVFSSVTFMPRLLRRFIRDRNGDSLVELDYNALNPFSIYRILTLMDQEYETNASRLLFDTELSLYRGLLSGGDFYNDFKEAILPDMEIDRETVKELILHYWFNGKQGSRNAMCNKIKAKFPVISRILDEMKGKDYKGFCNLLMRMESLLIRNVYEKFIESHPKAVVYTVFDAFLIEKKSVQVLQDIMTTEGGRLYNMNINVKMKILQ